MTGLLLSLAAISLLYRFAASDMDMDMPASDPKDPLACFPARASRIQPGPMPPSPRSLPPPPALDFGC